MYALTSLYISTTAYIYIYSLIYIVTHYTYPCIVGMSLPKGTPSYFCLAPKNGLGALLGTLSLRHHSMYMSTEYKIYFIYLLLVYIYIYIHVF